MSKTTGSYCAINGCFNYRGKTTNISYHQFPRDPKLKNEWKLKCCREGGWYPRISTVCSIHFRDEDFERDLRSELMGGKIKKNLKKGAIPSKYLPGDLSTPHQPTSSGVQCQEKMEERHEKEKRELESDLVHNKEETEKITEIMDIEPVDEEKIFLRNKIEKISQQLKEKVEEIEKLKIAMVTSAEEKLKDIFSPNELKLLLKKTKKVRWTSDEIAKAFALLYINKKAYVYVRETLKYPLPGISSLQRWAKQMTVQRGILHNALKIMKVWGDETDLSKKLTVLSFDEIRVQENVEYYPGENEWIGPFKQAVVVMARGLCSSWKQPIYLDFDVTLDKKALFLLIDELNAIGFPVVACVCDCATVNRNLWYDLGITLENSSFVYKTNEVFLFPDALHLLKLLRNSLLDYGFTLRNGQQVTKEPLVSLIEFTPSELSICHKLSNDHIHLKKSHREKVMLASELLSHTTASALACNASNLSSDIEATKATAYFIGCCNKWFNIMNTRFSEENEGFKIPYGLDKTNQDSALDEMYHLISTMRSRRKKGLPVFQNAILISINSLKKMYTFLKQKYNISYILTSRINQDSLENLFSQIRTDGGLNDPSPVNFIYRLRMIILGKNPGTLPATSSYIETTEEYITAKVIKQSSVIIDHDYEGGGDVFIDSSSTDTASASSDMEWDT